MVTINSMSKRSTTIQGKRGSIKWINMINPRDREITELKRKFGFDHADLHDAYGNHFAQRPKLNIRPSYSFLLLQFPVYDHKSRTVEVEEIDFFVGDDYVVTSHKNILPPLVELANLCTSDNFYRDQYMGRDPGPFVCEIINRLQTHCYKILDNISIEIENIEHNIFAGRERRMVTEILFVKRNILNFRRSISFHKDIIKKILSDKSILIDSPETAKLYEHIIDHSKHLWELLERHKETIESLESTNITLVSFGLNDIMRTLTIFSVIVYPLTLLAGIFGMNTLGSMPFVDHPYGFWGIMVIMVFATVAMFSFFKRKRWI